ncbi:hypothetical protein SAMN05444580_12019 [Rhodococcus tukisamuensis]|uniref:Uncharacterized protein n=1 Tax=Rhodococcus tukisamuensis TaxID=168276 RepID=A0A1G7DQ85_9NOCA|nr:hypothetical protein SAMN05444580_12019 [Rhodococcus tukisamuensis]
MPCLGFETEASIIRVAATPSASRRICSSSGSCVMSSDITVDIRMPRCRSATSGHRSIAAAIRWKMLADYGIRSIAIAGTNTKRRTTSRYSSRLFPK